MKPTKITNKNQLAQELIAVSSALHTNDNGGLITGAEHALEHLNNVLHNIDAGIEGEVQRRLQEERVLMGRHFNQSLEEALESQGILKSLTRTIEIKFQNAINSCSYNFTSSTELDRFQKDLIKDLARKLCK